MTSLAKVKKSQLNDSKLSLEDDLLLTFSREGRLLPRSSTGDDHYLNPPLPSTDRDEEVRILTSLGLSKYNPKRVTIKDEIRVEEGEYIIDYGEASEASEGVSEEGNEEEAQ